MNHTITLTEILFAEKLGLDPTAKEVAANIASAVKATGKLAIRQKKTKKRQTRKTAEKKHDG